MIKIVAVDIWEHRRRAFPAPPAARAPDEP
jgi:hypothetical protein